MKDEEKTRTQLIQEVAQLREQIRTLKSVEKENTATLQEVERIAQLGHWELDLVNDTLFWSDEIYRIFGVSPQEFDATYDTFLQAVHPADRDFVNYAYWDSVKNNTPYNIVHRLLLNNGDVRYVHERCCTEYDEDGNPLRSVGTVVDITERTQAKEEIKTYREHLEELIEARTTELQKEIIERKRAEEEAKNIAKFPAENPNPVIRIAKNGIVLYANASGKRLLAVWGCEVNQLLPEDWRKSVQEVFFSQTSRIIEVECEDRIFSFTVAYVRDADYVNVYGHDITERKQAEKGLQQAKDKLEIANQELEKRVQEELQKRQAQQQLLIQRSKLESLGKLAAGIAHEINQPLAGISMGLDNVLLKLSSKKMTEEYLQQKIDVLLKHIDRIKHIIEHIRTFSREQVSTSIERVDVNEVCRNAISMLQTQYQNHNVIITSNLDETIGYVVGNTYKLEQVVLNLITNAKDAVDEKEQVIRDDSYQKHITISTSCDVDRIYVDIEDNGVGISEEHIQNIFDPFFTTKNPEHGTGLGLSVSYGIIKEIQGDISVQSQLGEYTLMRISLPRMESHQSSVISHQ